MKYSDDMEDLTDCPPASACAEERTAYRFAHEDLGDERNFLPVAKQSPQRYLGARNASIKCSMLGLSCYNTVELAVKKWQKIASVSPRFVDSVGKWIGKLELVPEDGVVTIPNHSGHFDFFEADGCDLTGRITHVCEADA